jgi:NAD(P)-dependent dehydrogenase (short-subunit alcohol dehydrogenase family)
MELRDQVIVLTGAAHGIGRAMAIRFARERPRALVLVDRDAEALAATARACGGEAVTADVTDAAAVADLASGAARKHGAIDLFCSNAGILVEGGVEVASAEWDRIWEVNVKSHLYAAQAVLPAMLERGRGYLLQTVSAAGLLTSIGAAPYSVSKHAALGLAEWIAVTYGGRGIGVSCLCPAFVRTAMVEGVGGAMGEWVRESAIPAEAVAEAVVAGLADERFLILPHADVAEHFRRKASDYDRWIRGMRRLAERVNVSK